MKLRTLFPTAYYFAMSRFPSGAFSEELDLAVDSSGMPALPPDSREREVARWLIGWMPDSPPSIMTVSVNEDGEGAAAESPGALADKQLAVGEFAILVTDVNLRISAYKGRDYDNDPLDGQKRGGVVAARWPLVTIDEVGYEKDVIQIETATPGTSLGGDNALPGSRSWGTGFAFRRKNRECAESIAGAVARAILAGDADQETKQRATAILNGRWEAGSGLKAGGTVARFRPSA